MRRPNAKGAFSLLEVIVVICIVLILAAVIGTATASSRRSAQTATCTSNLRQASQALEMYLADGDGRLPYALYYDLSPIVAYSKDPRILECPLDPYQRGANWQSTRSTGVRTSLMAPLTIFPEFIAQLTARDANYGVLACIIHGTRTETVSESDPVNSYSGQILRARKDTSVQRKDVRERCFVDTNGHLSRGRMYWDFFTDEPIPESVLQILVDPGVKETSCP